jgi:hypothetical protein
VRRERVVVSRTWSRLESLAGELARVGRTVIPLVLLRGATPTGEMRDRFLAAPQKAKPPLPSAASMRMFLSSVELLSEGCLHRRRISGLKDDAVIDEPADFFAGQP